MWVYRLRQRQLNNASMESRKAISLCSLTTTPCRKAADWLQRCCLGRISQVAEEKNPTCPRLLKSARCYKARLAVVRQDCKHSLPVACGTVCNKQPYFPRLQSEACNALLHDVQSCCCLSLTMVHCRSEMPEIPAREGQLYWTLARHAAVPCTGLLLCAKLRDPGGSWPDIKPEECSRS